MTAWENDQLENKRARRHIDKAAFKKIRTIDKCNLEAIEDESVKTGKRGPLVEIPLIGQ